MRSEHLDDISNGASWITVLQFWIRVAITQQKSVPTESIYERRVRPLFGVDKITHVEEVEISEAVGAL